MKRKIIGILVCMLLFSMVIPCNGTMQNAHSNDKNIIIVEEISNSLTLQDPEKITPFWYKTWGTSDNNWAMGVDSHDEYIYSVGVSSFSTTQHAFILKYNTDGDLIWDKTWEGEGIAGATDVTVHNEYIYVSGISGRSDNIDATLTKFDTDGNLLWSKTWGDEYESVLAMGISDYNDYIYLSGTVEGNIFLLKYDNNGNLIWNQTWTKYTGEGMRVVASEYGIFVTGVGSVEESEDAVLLKYDHDGNLVWERLWSDIETQWSIGLDISNNYVYVTGHTSSPEYHAFLLKYNVDGDLIWEKTWGGQGTEEGIALKTYENFIYVAGETHSYDEGGGDIFLLKYSDDGTLSWAKTWGDTEEELPYDMDIENEMIYIAGYTESYGAGGRDVLLLKCNLKGGKARSKLNFYDSFYSFLQGLPNSFLNLIKLFQK